MTTSRRPGSSRTWLPTLVVPLLAATFTAMACQLTTQLQPDSLSTSLLSVQDVDPDQDGVPSSRDNCPLTPNTDQVKNEKRLIGSACEDLLPSGLAIPYAQGAIQIQLDAGGRPTRIATPALTLGIAWSDSAGTLDLTLEAGDGLQEFTLRVDFGDVAILEAAQAVQASSKADTTFIRSWVADHSGWVLAIATGRMAPLLSQQSSLPAPGDGSSLVSFHPQQGREDVELYIGELSVIVSVAFANYNDYAEQHPELDPVTSTVRNQLLDVATAVSQAATEEVARCEPWTIACHYKGTPGTCLLPDMGRQVCIRSGDLECIALGGRVGPVGGCPGACWAATENLPPWCAPTDQRTCEALPGQSNIPGRGFYLTAVFCPERGCADPLCKPDEFPGRVP